MHVFNLFQGSYISCSNINQAGWAYVYHRPHSSATRSRWAQSLAAGRVCVWILIYPCDLPAKCRYLVLSKAATYRYRSNIKVPRSEGISMDRFLYLHMNSKVRRTSSVARRRWVDTVTSTKLGHGQLVPIPRHGIPRQSPHLTYITF